MGGGAARSDAPVRGTGRRGGMEFLDPSDTRTTCPHKGEATHYHIAANSGPIRDAAWSYETPVAGAEAIAGFVAFYGEKATIEAL